MTTPLFIRVDCLSIPVPDVDAALAFYSANLGHELIWRSSKAAGLKLPGSNAELVLHHDDRPMETDLGERRKCQKNCESEPDQPHGDLGGG
jgi:catechol 2,3-dioxygenase-like lactoylglutathione lyase family enzyme